jgi:transcriptional regulator with XRE-family HTH domain
MKLIGKKIRMLRHQKGWSQEEVSKQLDISIPAFSKIETGVTDINISRLEQIAALFKLTVIQLLSYSEPEQDVKLNSDIDTLTKKLQERESEVIDLQKKIIELYEEIRNMKSFA